MMLTVSSLKGNKVVDSKYPVCLNCNFIPNTYMCVSVYVYILRIQKALHRTSKNKNGYVLPNKQVKNFHLHRGYESFNKYWALSLAHKVHKRATN